MIKPLPLTIATLLMLLTACQTMQDAEDAKGTGEKHVYSHPYTEVYEATKETAEATSLKVIAENQEKGEILAQHEMSAFSYGEDVAIYVSKLGENSTEVEIVAVREMKTNAFAPNWTKTLFKDIDAKLGGATSKTPAEK